MFLKKFFSKEPSSLFNKGKKYFADERYAESRHLAMEAMQLASEVGGSPALCNEIEALIAETGKHLALLNLTEAERALRLGEFDKAGEHIMLATDFSSDPSVIEKIHKFRGQLTEKDEPLSDPGQGLSNCSGCQTGSPSTNHETTVNAEHLSFYDRFELMVQPLPADLPGRYLATGKRFAEGYVMLHDGDEIGGRIIYEDLMRENETDILCYEMALIHHKNENISECESFFRKGLLLNEENPLCNIGLVQLLAETGRNDEAIQLLHSMIAKDIVIDQATILLGDIFLIQGDESQAIETFSRALDYPGVQRIAAERLVNYLASIGKNEDARFIFKRFLKGCK
jgi:tetratricopeptide (TPR) repeat protein